MNELRLNNEMSKMTSLQIAEVTGKPHNDVLKAIRNMEPAWVKIAGGNFSLCKYVGDNGKELPMYELSKTECLYIATKFNDEARAKLILRWEQLETDNPTRTGSPETLNLLAGQHELIEMLKKELCDIREAAGSMERTLKARQAEKYMRSTFISFSRYLKKKYPRVNLTPEKQEEYEWWLKMHCKDNDVPIDEVYDDNRYPIEAIDDFFWQSLNRYKIK